jgi:hypothetical protein
MKRKSRRITNTGQVRRRVGERLVEQTEGIKVVEERSPVLKNDISSL